MNPPTPARRPAFDPIVVVAALLLLLFVGSAVRSAFFGDRPPASAEAPVLDGTLTLVLRRVTATPSRVAVGTTPQPTRKAPTATALPPTVTPAPPTAPPPTATPAQPTADAPPESNMATPDFTPPTATATLPLPTPAGGATSVRVPILMYHYTSEPPADADIYRRDLSVNPEALRAQLTYLRDNGYTPIDLYQLAGALAGLTPLPDKPVVLTFDDGYRDNYEVAFPLLREFGMVGTFFIVTDFASSDNPNYMTWAMVREMAAAGMRMEIHTRTHPDLREQERDFVVWQIQGAQQALAEQTGQMPRFIAYPGGTYDEQTLEVVRALDLWGAVTTVYGSWHSYGNRYEMKRVRMRYTTTIPQFAALLRPEP